MMIGCVYLITNAVNGSAYIGKSVKGIKHRLAQHLAAANRGENWAFYRALRKYGQASFIVSEIYNSDSDAALLQAEVSIIAAYRASGMRLYNSTHGGQGSAGRSPSPETRQRIREKAIGRVLSKEHRAKIGSAGKGQTRSPEWRAAMSEKRREYWDKRHQMGLGAHDRQMTDEGRRALSESARSRWAQWRNGDKSCIGKAR